MNASRIKYNFLMAMIVESLLVVAAALVFIFFDRTTNKLVQFQKKAGEMKLIADRMRQSSDDLTRFARTYVVMGDKGYLEKFNKVLSIRNGESPRPLDYFGVYWDFINPEEHHANGEPISLNQLIERAGFSALEKSLIEASHKESDELVNLEVEAFMAMEGKFKDQKGEYTLKKSPNQQLAIELLHGERYHLAKEKIMMPLDDFFHALDERIENTSKRQESLRGWLDDGFKVILFLLLAHTFYLFFYLKMYVYAVINLEKIGAFRSTVGRLNHEFNNVTAILLANLSTIKRHTKVDKINESYIRIERAIQRFTDIMRQFEETNTYEEDFEYTKETKLPKIGTYDE